MRWRRSQRGARGSPPRAWGRREQASDRRRAKRFTPTCVGTTPLPLRPGRLLAVHPHVRGDDICSSLMISFVFGSPPRAWGRLRHAPRACPSDRFTPTCVGTTIPFDAVVLPTSGSPPRAWGRRLQSGSRATRRRFTPTCVGTTEVGAEDRLRVAVHPHVRGDDASRSRRTRFVPGSPPRAWGRHLLVACSLSPHRFTPTCVGTTMGVQLSLRLERFTPTCVGTTPVIVHPS